MKIFSLVTCTFWDFNYLVCTSDKQKCTQGKINLAEALTYFQDLEVSGGSDSESDIDIKHRDSKKIQMEKFSDVDYVDEEESSINKLCGN